MSSFNMADPNDPLNILTRREVIPSYPSGNKSAEQLKVVAPPPNLGTTLTNPITPTEVGQRLTEIRQTIAQVTQSTLPPSETLAKLPELFETSSDPDLNH